VLLVELEFDHLTEVFSAFGKRGLPAEKVARQMYREIQEYLRADAPVGPHLADQLLLPLAVGAHRRTGGGSFRTTAVTDHTATHINLLQRFLDVRIATRRLRDHDHQIQVRSTDTTS
jgi:RNA 3'-terminal phosphate cyclase (ATP)